MPQRIFYQKAEVAEVSEPRWSSPAEFSETWKGRVGLMASLITEPGVVADFGCGKMWLKSLLGSSNSYLGIDYIARDQETLVLDLNHDSLAGIHADVGFFSGVLEYIEDLPGFLEKLKVLHLRQLVFSYCTLETHPDIERRRQLNWVSHESIYSFLNILLPQYDLTAIGSAQGDTILAFNLKSAARSHP